MSEDMALQNVLIVWALACALSFVLALTATAQQDERYISNEYPSNLPPSHPGVDWTDLKSYFIIGRVLWDTPTHLRFRLRAREYLSGIIYAYGFQSSDEWYEKWPVDIASEKHCGEHCYGWDQEEEKSVSVEVPPNTHTVKFVFQRFW